ncbi:dnaJ-like protein subfamily C member 7-like protein [Senna tora]|uniref:DnaJ-like protein subfamily C member 7-like protein n=1 Tax=Senna tora TaxID=362788 RepID=A0A834TCQ5_9FABA|nr:dnaJ-like protein subfamily C member 7-like protein [Senna tora]
MSSAMKAALINSKSNYMPLRAALFHSTPVLERKRRNHWDSRFNHYSKRCRRIHAKQTLLRNMNAYADFLLQSWKDRVEDDEDDPSSSRHTSWFRKDYSARGPRRDRKGNERSRYYYTRDSEFPDEDFDVENVFRSAFGGNRFFYWSFVNEENTQRRRSERYSHYSKSWNWRHESEDEYDSSTESDSSNSGIASDREVVKGTSASGFFFDLIFNQCCDVSYRTCALKWHPDRHQGSSKAVAEEKFKLCSAAYQSLCDKLAIN